MRTYNHSRSFRWTRFFKEWQRRMFLWTSSGESSGRRQRQESEAVAHLAGACSCMGKVLSRTARREIAPGSGRRMDMLSDKLSEATKKQEHFSDFNDGMRSGMEEKPGLNLESRRAK